MNCFECGCSCSDTYTEVDDTLRAELNLPMKLYEIAHSSIGWYIDKNLGTPHMIDEWFKESEEGLYFLWYKDDYCDTHHLFHFKCLYVGKGSAAKRIAAHWSNKELETEGLVYFTFFKCQNRIAKYLEQLILDVYDVPFNKNEKKGKKKLCGYFTQNEVD